MKKISVLTVLVAFLGFTLASLAFVDNAAQGTAAQKTALKTHSGEVVSVDTAKNQIVIKDKMGKEMTLPIGADAKITKDGEAIALADIKVGDKVSCEVDESTGKCKSIRVTAAKARTS